MIGKYNQVPDVITQISDLGFFFSDELKILSCTALLLHFSLF